MPLSPSAHRHQALPPSAHQTTRPEGPPKKQSHFFSTLRDGLLWGLLALFAIHGMGACNCDQLSGRETSRQEEGGEAPAPEPVADESLLGDGGEGLPESPDVPHDEVPALPDKISPEAPEESFAERRPEETSSPEEGLFPEPPQEALAERFPEDPALMDNPQSDDPSHHIDWCSLQWPPILSLRQGGTSAPIFGQIYINGLTDKHRTARVPGLKVELGYGPRGSHPLSSASRWTWKGAVSYHKNTGLSNNNQEYRGTLTVSQAGVYHYTYRYSLNNGPWYYGDRGDYGRKGSSDGISLQELGVLVVVKPGATTRIASFNLHCLEDRPQQRLTAIARGLRGEAVDLIALQEVCRPSSGGPHAAQQLATLLQKQGASGYRASFVQTHVATHRGQSYDEGLGLLTRLPLVEGASFPVPKGGTRPTGAFPRKGLWARLAAPVGVLSFVSTHLSYRSDHESWRVQQASTLKTQLTSPERSSDFAMIIGGDFNAIPQSQTYKTMTTSHGPSGPPAFRDLLLSFDPGSTFPATQPNRRIDYLFLYTPPSSPLKLSITTAKRLFASPISNLYLSDHLGLCATIRAD